MARFVWLLALACSSVACTGQVEDAIGPRGPFASDGSTERSRTRGSVSADGPFAGDDAGADTPAAPAPPATDTPDAPDAPEMPAPDAPPEPPPPPEPPAAGETRCAVDADCGAAACAGALPGIAASGVCREADPRAHLPVGCR